MPRRITPHQTNEEFETKIGAQSKANRSKREAIGEANDHSDGRLNAHIQNEDIHHTHPNTEALSLISTDRFNNLLFDGERYATQSSYRDLMREIANINLHLEAEDRVINGATIGDTFTGSGSVDDGGIGMSYKESDTVIRGEEGLYTDSSSLSPAIRKTIFNNGDNVPTIDFEELGLRIDSSSEYGVTEGHQRFLKVGNKYFFAVTENISGEDGENDHVILVSEDDCETWQIQARLSGNRSATRFCALEADADGRNLFAVFTSTSSGSHLERSNIINLSRIGISGGSSTQSIVNINRTPTTTSTIMTNLRPSIYYDEQRDEVHIACVVNYSSTDNTIVNGNYGNLRYWKGTVNESGSRIWSTHFLQANAVQRLWALDAVIVRNSHSADGYPAILSAVYWRRDVSNCFTRIYANRYDESSGWQTLNSGYGSIIYEEADAPVLSSELSTQSYILDYPLTIDHVKDIEGNDYIALEVMKDVSLSSIFGRRSYRTNIRYLKGNGRLINASDLEIIASMGSDSTSANFTYTSPKVFVDAVGKVTFTHKTGINNSWTYHQYSTGNISSNNVFGGSSGTNQRLYELQIIRSKHHDLFVEFNNTRTLSNVAPSIWAVQHSGQSISLRFTGFWRVLVGLVEEGEEFVGTARYRLEYDTDEVVLWVQTTSEVQDIKAYFEGSEMDSSYVTNSLGREYQFSRQVDGVVSDANIDLELQTVSARDPVPAIIKLIGGVSNV